LGQIRQRRLHDAARRFGHALQILQARANAGLKAGNAYHLVRDTARAENVAISEVLRREIACVAATERLSKRW
jgi:hypothetical protein